MKPNKTTEQGNPNSINYLGSSMNPTLKPGDCLLILPYDGRKVCTGDVIVFIPPAGHSQIVHRVVSVDPSGIKTRGDNCNQVDDWVLSPEHILGRVISARGVNRRRRIFGGPLGGLFAVAVRVTHAVDLCVSFLLRPAYDEFAKAGIFIRLLPAKMRPRVISFDRSEGKELQLLMGRRVIGRWMPGKTGWHIRRPFRLFVDEASLPGNPARGSVVRSPSSVVDEA
jgi:hypothetical protein